MFSEILPPSFHMMKTWREYLGFYVVDICAHQMQPLSEASFFYASYSTRYVWYACASMSFQVNTRSSRVR